jgi:hypothetical protein
MYSGMYSVPMISSGSKSRLKEEKKRGGKAQDHMGISAGYFIDRRGALGVMTGQRALLEYQTAGFSSRTRRVFT